MMDKYNINIEPLTFSFRLLGLILFKFLKPEYAYIINTTIVDGLDSRIVVENFTRQEIKEEIKRRFKKSKKFIKKISEMVEYVQTDKYLYQDKLSDNILRFVSLLFKYDDPTLKYLYIFRSIGEILVAITGDRRYLFYFPDLFKIFYIRDLIPDNYQMPYLVIGSMLKMYIEYIHHSKKKLGNVLPEGYMFIRR